MTCVTFRVRALLERIWHEVASIAEAVGADVYDWESSVQSDGSRSSCMSYDGVHPSMRCGLQLVDMVLSDLRGRS